MRSRVSVAAWRAMTITSLVVGYAGYDLCRPDLAAVAPLLVGLSIHPEGVSGRGGRFSGGGQPG